MKYLFVWLCLILLVGCSYKSANMKDFPESDSIQEEATMKKDSMSTAMPISEYDSTEVTPTSPRADLGDYGAAPELTNEVWLNTDQSLRLADLRGKVVLLEMWTFG